MDSERLHPPMESAGDKRKQPPLPPIKGDGSLDYDGKSILIYIFFILFVTFLLLIVQDVLYNYVLLYM